MDDFRVREFYPSDRSYLRKMLEMAALPTYPELLKLGKLSLRERLDEIFENAYDHPEKRIWVAETAAGEPAGMIWIQPSLHPVTELADYLVLNIAVEPAYRGRGLGGRLVETARAHCERRGVRRLRLFVSAANEPAYRLYRKLGFRDQTREMLLTF